MFINMHTDDPTSECLCEAMIMCDWLMSFNIETK